MRTELQIFKELARSDQLDYIVDATRKLRAAQKKRDEHSPKSQKYKHYNVNAVYWAGLVDDVIAYHDEQSNKPHELAAKASETLQRVVNSGNLAGKSLAQDVQLAALEKSGKKIARASLGKSVPQIMEEQSVKIDEDEKRQ